MLRLAQHDLGFVNQAAIDTPLYLPYHDLGFVHQLGVARGVARAHGK